MNRIVDASGLLISDLWVDQADAEEHLSERARRVGLSDTESAEARRFINDGYAVLDLGLSDELFAVVDRDIDRLWAERPKDVAYGSTIGGVVGDFAMADVPGEFTRSNPNLYRLCCAHSHSDALEQLYFNETIHRFIAFTFGQPCVAVTSLYFEYGSRQGQHRDTSVVSFDPLTHLGAVWIALEDVGPDCGPLEYIPKSHRVENFQFPDGSNTATMQWQGWMMAFARQQSSMNFARDNFFLGADKLYSGITASLMVARRYADQNSPARAW